MEYRSLHELDVYSAGDQPVECPKCGHRTEFIEVDHQMQQHKCKNCSYEFFLDLEEEEEEDSFESERSFLQTHFEVSGAISLIAASERPHGIVKRIVESQGTTGLYDLALQLTTEFENKNKGRQWDGEFFEEIEQFLEEKLY